jgi:3-oxoacyl-[acyl-carrier-protein] synthase-3
MFDLKRDEIDAVVFVSQSRDYILPTSASIIHKKLGLKEGCLVLDVPNGCSGSIYGLVVANSFLASGAANKVLLLAGETNSKMINEHDYSVKMIFGDAGTATLLGRSQNHSQYFNVKTDGSGFDKIIIPEGGYRQPFSSQSLIGREDANGNVRCGLDTYMDGMSVFNFAINQVPLSVKEAFTDLNLSEENVDLIVLHQASQMITNQIARGIKFPKHKVPFGAGEVGNTGPASIPLLLSMEFSNCNPENLTNVMLCGFGVGLNWGVTFCNLSNCKILSPIVYS